MSERSPESHSASAQELAASSENADGDAGGAEAQAAKSERSSGPPSGGSYVVPKPSSMLPPKPATANAPPPVPAAPRPATAPPPPRQSSRPPSYAEFERLAGQLLPEDDARFLVSLKRAGMLGELEAEELAQLVDSTHGRQGHTRRIDMLEQYYRGSERRVSKERFFVVHDDEKVTAKGLVERIAALTPELKGVVIERIGTDDGPLVLRCGETFSAVFDDEDDLDTGEVNLQELEPRETVTLRGIVRGVNVLLERGNVRERFVPLRSDAHREVYVAVPAVSAMALADAGLLDEEDTEELMELGGW